MKNLAILSFLLSFILVSCGDDSSSSVSEFNEESEISSSSSEKANRDSKSSSSSSEKAEKLSVINKTISGMAQGPFEKGATVSVYELDTNFQQTGISYETKIKNDSGSYSIKLEDFKSQYALFKVNGRYIDNITGAKSAYSITLYAFTDLDNHDNVNINFLTHLSYKRILYLTNEKDIPVTSAKKQAETEILRAFDIKDDGFDDAENIDIFGKDKQSAALLAISVLMQGNLLNTSLNDRLTSFSSDIEKDGKWDKEQAKKEIADWANCMSLNSGFDKVKSYIKKWNQTVDLSAFEKYVEKFLQQNYDFESTESSKTIIKCELDTLDWKDTTEGAIRKGDITDAIYIFNNKKWRVATLPEASLGACNEKTVNFWGYVEERKMQDLNDPRKNECIDGYGICSVIVYSPGYYICLKNGQNKFYWDRIDVRYYEEYVDTRYYDYICNDPSYYANSKEGDAHWGNIEPVKKKCINCKQENFDYWDNICKKYCYVLDGWSRYYLGLQKRNNGWREGATSECALGLGCTESRFGIIKEGPALKTNSNGFSIDSTQKRTYICRYPYSEGLDEFPTEWYIASDIDIELAPKLCDNWWGILISGKNNNKYVCDLDGFRLATQEEIEVGIACTEYNMYVLEKCSSELEKETGMTCTEYMRRVEKCRTKLKE